MQMMGIILAGGASQIPEISDRATAALPMAGKYDAIDFSLSSMVNSDINTVAVVSLYNSRLLSRHLKDATWWNFGRKNGGLYLVNPEITPDKQGWYDGTVEALRDALPIMYKSHEPYVIIASGDGIYNMDFRKALEYHINKQADVTVVTASRPQGRGPEYFGQVVTDENGVITEFLEKNSREISNEVSCGIYIIRRRAFIAVLEEAENKKDFVTEILCPGISSGKVYAYHHDGYWNSVTAPQAYFDCNMDFLKDEVRADIFGKERQILTRIRDGAPAKFMAGSKVKDSLVAEATIISGSVEHSVVFRGARIGKGAVVKNSLIMQNSVVPEGAVIENRLYYENNSRAW